MRALLLIDIQNDFMPFGALPVAQGDAVVDVANRLMGRFGLVVATQDWHPANHSSFASSHVGRAPGDLISIDGVDQILWADHCVQSTPGASFHSALDVSAIDFVVRKGSDPAIDSYSGFFDNGRRRETELAGYLSGRGVNEVWIAGLATDYCVKYTALDARELGLDVTLVSDACRGVEVATGDVEHAVEEMRVAGCRIAVSDQA